MNHDLFTSERPRVAWATALVLFGLASSAFAGERYAFLVAVREYDKNELTSLRFTENDVTKLARILKGAGYPAENVVLMTQSVGAQKARFIPTAENIREELSLLVRELNPDDSIIVGFAGHGVQFKDEKNAYFCPSDARLADRNTLISLEDLYKTLDTCAARTKVLFVDACRNDPLSNLARSAREVELEATGRRVAPVPPSGIAAMFSCSATEQSYEDPGLKHGVFFHYVVDGLSGNGDLDKDGEVSLAELEQHVTKSVQRYVRTQLGKAQTPERRGEARGLISLAKVTIPSSLDGKAQPVYLGIKIRRPTTEQAKQANLPRITGAFAIGILPNSPAYDAGFNVGDLVLKIDEQWIEKYQDLPKAIAKRKVDDEVTIVFVRDGQRQQVTATLEVYPGDAEMVEVIRKLAQEGHEFAEAHLGFSYRDGIGVAKDDQQALEWFQKAAEHGDVSAQTELGEIYLAGRGIEKDLKQAEKWLLKAAEQEDVVAMTRLGDLYYDGGPDLPVDHAATVKWYTRASELGDGSAQVGLARLYFNGIGVEKDFHAAFKWYSRAAEQNFPDGYYGKGMLLHSGNGTEKDLLKALENFQLAAQLGHLSAKAAVGAMLVEGQGVPRDSAAASKWLLEAADAGHAESSLRLASLYVYGDGVKKDEQLAAKYFRVAADQGLPVGQYSLGVCYRDGFGATKDYAEALKWFRKGAEQGEERSLNALGAAYEFGQGVDTDLGQAMKYYVEAAKKGNAIAQYNVGSMIVHGKGVQQDYQAALGWFKSAAKQDIPNAVYNIGYMYDAGLGVAQDRNEAISWYRRAASLGSEEAKKALRNAGL